MIKYPNIDPVIFNIYGNFGIRWYSLAYIIGIFFVQKKIHQKLKDELSEKQIESLFNYLILFLIIGLRLFFVLFYDLKFYIANPIAVLKIWEGGLSFHGGLVGLLFGSYLFSRKNNIHYFKILDLIALNSGIGIFLGRIANFINGELYGRYTDSWIGMIFPADILQIPRHPSQLYEAIFEGLLMFFILNFLNKKYQLDRRNGLLGSIFLILYGVFRFFIEFFREPDINIGYILKYFTQGQVLCLIMIFSGFILSRIIVNKKLIK